MVESRDRVRDHTDPCINKRIDSESSIRLKKAESLSNKELSKLIKELDGEWDIERYLELNAATLAFSGLVLGTFVKKKWLLLPGVVLPFLIQHAIQGWCPPLEILRRFGIRTRHEIDAEKFALQVLRGDYKNLSPGAGRDKSSLAIQAYRIALPDYSDQ